MIRVICTNISDITDLQYRSLYETASAERQKSADRYRNHTDAIHCVTADALLRHALGTEVCTVEKNSYGKPFIPARADFHYNLSHSGNWVVLASGSSKVGVDVEEIRADIDIAAVAHRFFSSEEQEYILKDPLKSSIRFFEIWVGKESYVKYLGTGLHQNMTSFSIFSLNSGLQLHRRMLDDRHILSLCTTCYDYAFESLNIKQLL